jgi:hypothetical protein
MEMAGQPVSSSSTVRATFTPPFKIDCQPSVYRYLLPLDGKKLQWNPHPTQTFASWAGSSPNATVAATSATYLTQHRAPPSARQLLNRKTDLERSVSLLTPHHPSDHIQVAVLRPSNQLVAHRPQYPLDAEGSPCDHLGLKG